MSEYVPTIGLEIHAELKTRTKMFCACANNPEEKNPNRNICPVCMAHPGSLPTINRNAVEKVLLVGKALDATLADYTEFDRKNYFYPDIPKGYQISQFAYPLVRGGALLGVDITRIHLEEDTARSQHTSGVGEKVSLVDYNRAGVPLMELVTEPVIHSAEQAGAFARELQLLLRYLGVSDANLEKGEMRVEANISVSKDSTATLSAGTLTKNYVEVKNINSFRSVERAIAFEIDRQIAVLEGGGQVAKETRGWDEVRQVTFSQRKKESSDDYRYFPDPDLPKLLLSEIPDFSDEALRKNIGILPWVRRDQYLSIGIKSDDADLLVRQMHFGDFFDTVAQHLASVQAQLLAVNYIVSDLVSLVGGGEEELSAQIVGMQKNAGYFADLILMLEGGSLSSKAAKEILPKVIFKGEDPKVLAEKEGLLQKSDVAFLATVVEDVIKDNPSVVADYRAGKEVALQFLLGQGMRITRGSANPEALKEHLLSALK